MEAVVNTEIAERRPLVVDLDGTLVRSDLLIEALFAYLGKNPFGSLKLIRSLASGKAELKHFLAETGDIDARTLPYNEAVLSLIGQIRLEGRPVYLATASHSQYAEAIAHHLGIFEGVIATSRALNLNGEAKAAALVAQFGDRGFDYVGDHADDLAVWEHATTAYVIGGRSSLLRKLSRLDSSIHVLPKQSWALRDAVRALRIHQYVKNVLVFVPLLASHSLGLAQWFAALLAFISFSAAASAVYLMNDLVDLQADRGHPTKRARPLASGALPVRAAIAGIPVLLLLAFGIAAIISPTYLLVLVGYVGMTTAYTLHLKRKMLADVVALAMLYTLRVIAGGVAANVTLSEWLLAFCLFVFSSLALIKRYTELTVLLDRSLPDPTNRNYRKGDLVILATLAGAAGTNAVTVLAMYVSSPDVIQMYHRPRVLWLLCPLILYLVSRALLMSHRREMHDDPIVWALRDKVSRLAIATAAVIVLVAA